MKKNIVSLIFSSFSLLYAKNHIANITGDVTSNVSNTGDVISVAGASFKLDLTIAKASIDIGSAKGTVTNLNTIIIHNDSSVHNVSLHGKNSGKIINVGSKVNVNSIIIGN